MADAFVSTATVFIVNWADVPPEGTVTELGVEATELELLRDTFSPPFGAAPEIRTVPVALLPPLTDFGVIVSDLTD